MKTQLACAITTPAGRAAVTSICVWGADAVATMVRLVRSPYQGGDLPIARIVVGCWTHATESGEQIVLARRDANVFEVHCHGGVAAAAAIVGSLQKVGAELLTWQDVPSFQEKSRLEREALEALALASTELSVKHLLAQGAGALDAKLTEILACLQLEEEAAAGQNIDQLMTTARAGLHLTDPFQVAICGPPNVGKSSLINALVGFQRSIVFDQPGTTRDVLAVDTAIDGWPVRMHDTAGLREASDAIEAEGIQRALQAAANAELVVLVFDQSVPWQLSLQRWVQRFPAALIVHNKSDLGGGGGEDRPVGTCVSALQETGLPQLIAAMKARLLACSPAVGDPLVFTRRQLGLLDQARAALHAARALTAEELLLSIR